jgi:FkbM family methyltransferase
MIKTIRMFKKIESSIIRSPFYNLVRFNLITDLIIELTTKKTQKNINFYSSFLDQDNSNKLIFDIGANKGNKVKAFLKMGYRVIAVEPEKKALSTLKWRFAKNKNVTIVDQGVSDKEGTLDIHIADSRSGLNTLSDKWVNTLETGRDNRIDKKHAFKESYKVNVTTADQIFAKFGLPYFMKIDVEGYEINVLKGMSKLPPYLSFETNLPEFKEETLGCIDRLQDLSGKIMFNYSIDDKLESAKWLTAGEIVNLINDPSIRYMEIICKFPFTSVD